MSKKFVQISNNGEVAICVTKGLQSINATNLKSPRADRLSVKPAWGNLTCTLRTGMHYYPCEVKSWSTVKALQDQGVITIGIECDPEMIKDPKELAKAEELFKSLSNANAKFEKDKKANADILAKDAESGREATEVK